MIEMVDLLENELKPEIKRNVDTICYTQMERSAEEPAQGICAALSRRY